jgi:hypothetical protein
MKLILYHVYREVKTNSVDLIIKQQCTCLEGSRRIAVPHEIGSLGLMHIIAFEKIGITLSKRIDGYTVWLQPL